jgi:hypothetical protein
MGYATRLSSHTDGEIMMGEHWYSREGMPAYEVEAKSGAMRATTLADARKIGLVPSVTTVLAVLAKPQLETWKVRQGILAALTMPRKNDEPDSSYLDRVLSDSRQQVIDAAEEGSRVHDAIERSYKGLDVPDRYIPHVEAARAEVERLYPEVNDWIAESSFACPSGYGGKVDLHSPSTGIVVDFKGKDGDFSDGKRLGYDQHYQLAAYNHGLGFSTAPCANVFFSRSHPGAVKSHQWKEAEIEEGWRVFSAALSLWAAIRKFDPSFSKDSA